MAKRMPLLYFSLLHFCSAELKYSKFTVVVWSHQGCLCFSKTKMCFPLVLPLCWDEQDKGNLQVLLCGQELDRLPGAGSLGPGQLCCLMPGGLGNLGFSQRTCSSGVSPMARWALMMLGSLGTSDPETSTLRAPWKPTQQSSPSSLLFVGTVFLVFTANRSSNWSFSSTISNGEAFSSGS